MKKTIHIFVVAKKETDYLTVPAVEQVIFEAYPFDMSKHTVQNMVLACEADVEVDVPDTFDFIAAEVAALNRERERIRAELGKRLMEIEDRISKLTCIGMEPTA